MDIHFKDVNKQFGSVSAVENLNLYVEDGEFVVLLGPSGSGKSTVLNMVAGLEKPNSGDILGGGGRLNDLEPRERNIAMVFQSYALYPHMNVFDNIAFPLSIRGVAKNTQAEQVTNAAASLHIEHLLKRRIGELSGGEAQRVALARAIIRHPAAFLMDEPLSNLDAKLRVKMRAEIKRLHRKLRTTTLYVTHDQEEALALGDAVAILDHGRLQQFGTPDEIFEMPANAFVAGFIGTPEMNILEGQIVSDNGSLSFVGQGVHFSLPESFARRISSIIVRDQPILIGARPDDINIFSKPKNGAFAGKVDVVERIGRSIHAHIKMDGTVLRIITTADMQLSPQQTIWMTFDHERIHIFDGTTTERLKLSD